MTSQSSESASTGSLAIIPQTSKDKFEPKSAVLADTLSRELVNLNISGRKCLQLLVYSCEAFDGDIGIDFDAINRKEKRTEKPKPAATAPVSTTTMGKAMGSGSGVGRAGAGALRPPPNQMMGRVYMGMDMGTGPTAGMNMGLVGGADAGMDMDMGIGGAPGAGMGMGMGMGMGGFPGPGMVYPFSWVFSRERIPTAGRQTDKESCILFQW